MIYGYVLFQMGSILKTQGNSLQTKRKRKVRVPRNADEELLQVLIFNIKNCLQYYFKQAQLSFSIASLKLANVLQVLVMTFYFSLSKIKDLLKILEV